MNSVVVLAQRGLLLQAVAARRQIRAHISAQLRRIVCVKAVGDETEFERTVARFLLRMRSRSQVDAVLLARRLGQRLSAHFLERLERKA